VHWTAAIAPVQAWWFLDRDLRARRNVPVLRRTHQQNNSAGQNWLA